MADSLPDLLTSRIDLGAEWASNEIDDDEDDGEDGEELEEIMTAGARRVSFHRTCDCEPPVCVPGGIDEACMRVLPSTTTTMPQMMMTMAMMIRKSM